MIPNGVRRVPATSFMPVSTTDFGSSITDFGVDVGADTGAISDCKPTTDPDATLIRFLSATKV
jgi:hypothetical protein